MGRTRTEVRSLGGAWSETVRWYALAVRELRSRPIADRTSWRFLAAVHDFDPARWKALGYLEPDETLPDEADRARYWRQCQHQTWYFLPWHRAYLATFEDVVRRAVSDLGGPADWALPYWNYSEGRRADARRVPSEFLDRTMPDGSTNPLFVEARFGVEVDELDVDLADRIADHDFVGLDGGPDAGIGGPRTPFSLHGTEEGLLEAKPHDLVHGAVGGRGGLMSNTTTAALDPVFWLHHANIDRLWEVWLARDARNRNPTEEEDWMNGPTRVRRFALYDADGNDRPCAPGDVLSTSVLGYGYDDVSDPLGGSTRRDRRLEALRPHLRGRATRVEQERGPMARVPPFEVLGSSDGKVRLGAKPATSRVRLAPRPLVTLERNLGRATASAVGAAEPDRVFLRLENIRGKDGSGIFDVFVRKPGGPGIDGGIRAGSISLFGLEQASVPGPGRAGDGLTKTLEVTSAVDAMDLVGSDALDVTIVPRSDVRDEDDITVGQVSLHRAAPP